MDARTTGRPRPLPGASTTPSTATQDSSDGAAPVTRAAVVLASAGRPACVADAVRSCSALSGIAFQGVLSVPDEESLPRDRDLVAGWDVVVGTRGSSAQRNTGLDVLRDGVEFVAFFDDDSVIRHDYLRLALDFLDENPSVVGITGRVIMDGVRVGEVSEDAARRALESSSATPVTGAWSATHALYGCNFIVRLNAAPGMRFDERLPLYSWLEDLDFARRLSKVGVLAKVDDCVIVHRGASSGGRVHHLRYGYSQVMNPAYLFVKGTFSPWLVIEHVFRPVFKNLLYSLAGPHRHDRRKRLRGNALATWDLLRRRITPEKIVEL